MIQRVLKHLIIEACVESGVKEPVAHLEYPEDLANGDFSTNVAMAYAKSLGVAPKELAEKIAASILAKHSPYIQDIKIAGPGFLNFYLTGTHFNTELSRAATEERFANSTFYNGKKILVEHSSPNLFKPFHIGHVMNNAIGESVSRLAKASGADVTVISYPSDVSLGIGKAVWAMLEDGKEKWESLQTESEQLAYLGECYVSGTQALEADKTLLPRIQEITKHLYEKTESPELDAYEKGKKINLDYFIKMTEKLGSHFDAFIYESEAGKEGQNIVRENVGKVFEESEGAVIYAGEKDGLHTRVFINKEGYPTYEAKDVGLMSLKFSRYNPDVSLFVTDHQQKDYFKVVVTAAGKVNPVWKEKTTHLTHGRMSFKGQKMSSRLGGVPIASDILDVIVSEVSEKSAKLSETEKESVALAALKFAILRAGLGKNINFDPDTSLSFEGDSGPYVQYTAIRAQSVLAKAKEMLKAKPVVDPHAAKTPLAVYISRFPEVVELAIKSWEPHHVAIYLLSVAQSFNSWYAVSKIVDEKNAHIAHELALVQATHNVLKKGLDLLGIPLPEKM